ncbi:hypothetical protein ABK040_000474 [Willaertia magna]
MKSFAFNRSRNEKLYDSSLTVSLREPNPKDLLSELTIGLLSNNNDNDHYATDEKKNVTLLSSLESNEIEKIYRRMPELQVEEQQEFQVREKSMKPPKALESNILQFPLQEDLKIEKPKELEDEENRLLNSDLEVLRYLPEGEIKDRSVPFISITFSQPMIKLTTVNQVENQTIPVQIEPIPKNGGRWRWVGTNTLQYEPNYRFDMSTEYTVTIPQGTTSVLGGQLKKDVKFTFSTPRALVRSHLPSSGSIHPVNEVPVYYLEFDQEIDPKEVIPYISVEGKPEVRAKLINVDEIRKMLTEYNFEKRTHSYSLFDSKLKSAPSDRHVWFTLENKDTSIVTMALGEQVKLIVTEGVPSLEGPLKSNEKYEFTVTNYDELKVERNMITIEPIIERKNVSVSGGYLTIGGNIKGRTTYVVTLSENIRDVWGQSLKKSVSVTYNVGKARPSLQAFQSGLIVLDPTVNEKPSFSVFTVNLDKIHVTVTQVTPEMYSNDVFNKNNIIGNKVLDAIINTNGQPDEPTTTDIDLTLCLQNPKENLGQLMVWVEPDKESWTSEWEYRPVLTSWIQVTKLALDCIYEPTSDSVYAWANSLASGEKLTDVKINVKSTTEVQGLDKVISEDGVNRIKLSINSESNNNLLVYAEKDNDVCFIPSIYIYKNYFSNSTVSKFYNDRGLYKPNEEIFIKGFVREIRWVDDNTRYEIGLPNARTINYTVQDAFGKEYHKGTCELSASGSCNFSFTIPDNVNLGYHAVRINTGGDSEVYHNFQCQEFRTPEFIVYSSIPVSNYIVNGSAVCTTSATYYSGGGLSGSTINYTVRQSIANYSPPNWRGFVFDDSQRERYVRTSQVSNFNSSVDGNGEHKIVIDFNENDRIHKLPITLQVESLVQDINRQTIATSSNLIVHPCPLYCGVRLNKNYIQPKQNNEMQLIVTNIDGKPVEGVEMKVTIEKTEWKYKGMKYIKEQKLIKEDLLISTTDPLKYYLNVNEGGSYKVKVNIVDKETNLTNMCSTPFYAFGGDLNGEKQFGKRIREKSVTLISDKPYYEVGDVAKITVQSPFNGKSEGIIYFSLRGLIHKDYITIDPEKGFTEYSFPITKQHIPNLIANVTLVGSEKRVDDLGKELNDIPNQPAYANGSLSLPVSKLIHELTVDIVPESQFVTPGAKTKVEVIVKDKDGNLQENSEVTLIAIDEAILSLTNHKITNPLDTFIFNYYSGFSNYSIRGNLFVKDYSAVRVEQEEVRERMMARNSGFAMEEGVFLCSASSVNSSGMMFGGMDMGCVATTTTTRNAPMCLCDEDMEGGEEGGSIGPTINIRKNFNPVAVFEPTVLTNKEGKATIEFNLPDNLTKYRLTAIAVKDEVKAGVKESFIVAQLPLAIRPSLPRFLNFGDKAEFTCVLVNQTPITLPVNVAIRFTNLSILDESKRGLQVTIPSSERVELRFPLQTEKVGIAKFQIGVTIANQSINFADAVEKEIRVFTPATSEAFATYGEIDGTNNIFQKIEKPKDVYNQFGGLDITTSSTALSSLTDAFLYLYRYPYDCSEQLASKLISTVSLKDVLQSFNMKEIPSSQEIDKFINETLNCLYKKQFPNGGYGFWSYYNNAEICPYVTVFVCYSFVLAIKAGYNVDENNLQKLVHIISNIESHCEKYTMECKNSIKSFSYFVLSVLYQLKQNRNVMVGVNAQQLSQSIIKLYKETGMNTNLENLIWMAHGLYLTQNHQIGNECNEILQYILKNVNETAETANFITNYGDNQNSKLIMLHSSRRTDGIILNSLIEMDKKNTLIPKIVKGLLAHKKKGRWNNTQENVYILVALNNYFHTFENIVPDFITRIWLGEEYCGEQTFKGRSKDENLVQIPMSFLLKEEEEQENTLVIAKEGQGRLYYRLGLNSAPKNLLLPAVSYGFTVERTFEGVTSKDHVQFDVTRNCWRFKAGEVIRVKLTLSTTSRRYHVALVDYLPACLEALNPELKGTPNITDDTNEESKLNCCWWNRTWYEHQNLRDERVEAFTSFLLEGSHEFKYFARVTSIGSFVIPPTKAEEMYCPELFGRTGTEFVEIFE